jgi:hypothetical protein
MYELWKQISTQYLEQPVDLMIDQPVPKHVAVYLYLKFIVATRKRVHFRGLYCRNICLNIYVMGK